MYVLEPPKTVLHGVAFKGVQVLRWKTLTLLHEHKVRRTANMK